MERATRLKQFCVTGPDPHHQRRPATVYRLCNFERLYSAQCFFREVGGVTSHVTDKKECDPEDVHFLSGSILALLS